MAKMLITEALDERDFLEKKIKDKIERAAFVGLKKNNEDTVANSTKSAEEFTEKAKAALQSIRDLISRYHKIDGEIIKSNAVTMITVGNKRFSVAEAISIRSKMADDNFENRLANALMRAHNTSSLSASDYTERLEQNAQRLRETISGKENDAQSYAVVDEYIKNNSITKIGITDAIDIANEIKEGADEMLSAINTAIKVANATTYIEI